MEKFKQIINCHSHSHHSLDGAATVAQIVKRNKDLGATHVCLTEHGNLNSAIDLYTEAKAKGLKPIIGIELYLEPFFKEELREMIIQTFENPKKLEGEEYDKVINKKLHDNYTHLTVHFKDEWAYNYFCKLTPIMDRRSIIKVGEKKPICTLEELSGAAGHITIGSGCLISAVNKWLDPMKNKSIIRYDLAERSYQIIRSIAGPGNFFVEVFPHCITHNWKRPKIDSKSKLIVEPGEFEEIGCSDLAPDGDIQKSANQFIMRMAEKYKDPIIISLDSHYATEIQKLVQDARLGNGQDRWKFHEHLHIMTTDVAAQSLQKTLGVDDKTIESWVDNSYLFASKFDDFKMATVKDRWILAHGPEDYRNKLITSIQKHGRMDWTDPAMVKQLTHEVQVYAESTKFNMVPYVYPIELVADYCRTNGIIMNVRGSAGGSLLHYVLGISAFNPLKHDLSFERYITPGRINAGTLPDCDVDLPTGDRDKVAQYLESVYGDKICRISTETQLKLKSSLKDADRAINGSVSKATVDVCKKLPKNKNNLPEDQFVFGYEDDDGVYHDGVIETCEPLIKYTEKNPKVWESVKEMIGIIRQKSVHACAYVIADKAIQEYSPIMTIGGIRVTGYSAKPAEKAGLIKYDLLGLNTLKDIEDTLRLIKSRTGLAVDPWNLPQEKEIFEMFHRGETATIFQFDEVARAGLMLIKPPDIDGLSAVTALYRPGTMDAPDIDPSRTLVEAYIAGSKGEPVRYIHPSLEPILKSTFGVNVYQEQTLRIFRDIGGYSAEQAEVARRGIGKKDLKVLAESTKGLIDKCYEKGWTKEQIDLLIKQIMASARYSFNKSHSISCAYVAYACMWFKHHYPLEWWTSVLTNSSKEDLQKYWPRVSKMVILPDINISTDKFEIVKTGDEEKIRAPLNLIDKVGEASINEIVSKRPFASFKDFYERIDRRVVKKNVVYPLILADAMSSFFSTEQSYAEKAAQYEQLRAGTKTPDPIPEWLLDVSPLNQYLMKKKVFKVFSEDLFYITKDKLRMDGLIRPEPGNRYYVFNSPHDRYLDGAVLTNHAMFHDIITGVFFANRIVSEEEKKMRFAAIGYVLDTEDKEFMGASDLDKTKKVPKHMMKVTFEVGSDVITGVKWPDYKSVNHGIDKSVENSVCLFVLQKRDDGDAVIKKLIPVASLDERVKE